MNQIDQAIEALAAQFTDSFPAQTPARRTVGREAEYPVVASAGQAADVRRADRLPGLRHGPADGEAAGKEPR